MVFRSIIGSMTRRDILKQLVAFAACATALGLMPGMYGQQAIATKAKLSPDIAQQRRVILESIRTEETPELIARRRLLLAEGAEPELVRRARKEGKEYYPDANEAWLVVLRRDAEEDTPLELYKRIIEEGRGTEKPEELLNALGAAALNDRKEVRIGGEVVDATPALSLDAGYTKGFREKVTMALLGIADTEENIRKLHVLAEGCLDGQNTKPPSLSACFTAGLAFAAKDATRQR